MFERISRTTARASDHRDRTRSVTIQRSTLLALLAIALATAVGAQATGSASAVKVRFRDPIYSVLPVGGIAYAQKLNPSSRTLETLELDLYLPLDVTDDLRPAFLYLHGGSFRYGTRRDFYAVRSCAEMARRGYVGVAVSYRLRTGSGGGIGAQSAGEDCQDAIAWLLRNARTLRIDPERITVAGDSAGAAAAVWTAFGFRSPRPHPVRAIGVLWGWEAAAVRANGTAIYIAHGTDDRVVPFRHGWSLYQNARRVGLDAFMLSMAGVGHAPFDRFEQYFLPMVDYFYGALKLAQVAGLSVQSTARGTILANTTGPGYGVRILRLATRRARIDLGDPGIMQIDPTSSLLVAEASPRIDAPAVSWEFDLAIPALSRTLYWQAFFLDANGSIGLVSNSPETLR